MCREVGGRAKHGQLVRLLREPESGSSLTLMAAASQIFRPRRSITDRELTIIGRWMSPRRKVVLCE